MRKAINFFRSYYEVAKQLNDTDRLAFYDAILNKQFENIDTKLTGMANFAYISQKHSIDNQIKGYFDKTKDIKFNPNIPTAHPTVPPRQGATQPPRQPPTVQGEGQEQEQGKEQEKEKEQYKRLEQYFIDLENGIEITEIARINNLTIDFVKNKISEFKNKAELSYPNYSKFVSHFKNWIVKNKDKVSNHPLAFKNGRDANGMVY